MFEFHEISGATTTNQVARQIAIAKPQRADGGRRKIGPVSARNVRHHPRREPGFLFLSLTKKCGTNLDILAFFFS